MFVFRSSTALMGSSADSTSNDIVLVDELIWWRVEINSLMVSEMWVSNLRLVDVLPLLVAVVSI